jgi:hypothetical protein
MGFKNKHIHKHLAHSERDSGGVPAHLTPRLRIEWQDFQFPHAFERSRSFHLENMRMAVPINSPKKGVASKGLILLTLFSIFQPAFSPLHCFAPAALHFRNLR